jgi:hypothetical protein
MLPWLRLVAVVALSAGAPRRPARKPTTQRAPLPPTNVALASLTPGDQLRGLVLGSHGDKVFVDVRANRPRGGGGGADADNRTARVLACTRVPGLARALASRSPAERRRIAVPLIGAEVSVEVSAVQTGSGRLGARLLNAGPRRSPAAAEIDLESLAPGQPLRGVVVSQTNFDAFIDCGVRRLGRGGVRAPANGRLPLRELAESYALRRQLVRSEEARRTLRDGDVIDVYALEVLPSAGRFTLTMRLRPVEEMMVERAARARERARRRPAAESIAVGSVREGVVKKKLPYGLLIDVGAKTPGLLHANVLADGRASLGAFELGDAISVRVVESGAAAGEAAEGAIVRLSLALANGPPPAAAPPMTLAFARPPAPAKAAVKAAAPRAGEPMAAAAKATAAKPAKTGASAAKSITAAAPRAGAKPASVARVAAAQPRRSPTPNPFADEEDDDDDDEEDAKRPSLEHNMDDYLEDKYGW